MVVFFSSFLRLAGAFLRAHMSTHLLSHVADVIADRVEDDALDALLNFFLFHLSHILPYFDAARGKI